jgi:ABC-type multidrug transport system fused ATPase/permease subunit
VEAPELGPIELDAVHFAYADGADVLHGLDLAIGRGETVGLVGPSGSGKTTIVRILLRLLEPTDGQVRYAGVPLNSMSLASWYHTVAFVPQDPRLLTATVAENIDLFRNATRDEIESASIAAHLHDEVLALPDGYDTVVGPAGVALSGGQQQRLAMARALLREPRVLVLDEPTSALDVRSEARVQATLAGLRGRVTTVIIAHRLSTLAACDRIVVVVGGRIEAVGTHDELLRSSSFYMDAVRLSAT